MTKPKSQIVILREAVDAAERAHDRAAHDLAFAATRGRDLGSLITAYRDASKAANDTADAWLEACRILDAENR